jgi:hypothetical protein
VNIHSGIVFDGNTTPVGELSANDFYAQEFVLPENYVRGDLYVPDLTGFQILVNAPTDDSVAEFDWEVQRYNGEQWIREDIGSTSKILFEGHNWLNIEFSVPIEKNSVKDTWRFLFNGNLPILYGAKVKKELLKKQPNDNYTPVTFLNTPSVSCLHRVLAEVGDEGIDYLGNTYRHAIVKKSLENLLIRSQDTIQKSWMSKPNPSKFAVESLCFDVRDPDLSPSVINNILITATTPGVNMHVYYSSDESGPGTDEDSWDNLLWQKVPRTFVLNNSKTYALPAPISTKYIKLEFSQLQAKYYKPSDYQQKVLYKKHPKWVLDYFYSTYLELKTKNNVFSDYVTLRYNAFDLYYKYFLNDIQESPEYRRLSTSNEDETNFTNFLDVVTNNELSDTNLDSNVVNQIRTRMNLFKTHPMLSSSSVRGSSLQSYNFPNDPSIYPVETVKNAIADSSMVSSSDRESVLIDKEFPAMSFYLTCRHEYKKSLSLFEHEKAYFVGIQEVVFERDYYTSDFDHDVYNETAGDEENIETNDLISADGNWTTQ